MDKMEYPYPYSYEEAQRLGEYDLDLYKKSRQLNVECAKSIKEIINKNYAGYRLEKDLAKKIIAEYGYDRVNFVLANTIRHRENDGRISKENKEWAKKVFIPEDRLDRYDQRGYFEVNIHSGLLDIFTSDARKEYEALGLYGKKHCNSTDGLNFAGKLMILDPINLKAASKKPDEQIIYCIDGFGCSPTASGRKVYGKFLTDGTECQFYRQDFIGELKDEFVPDWARQKLEEIQKTRDEPEQGNLLDLQ